MCDINKDGLKNSLGEIEIVSIQEAQTCMLNTPLSTFNVQNLKKNGKSRIHDDFFCSFLLFIITTASLDAKRGY